MAYWIATSNWYKEIPTNYRPCSSAIHRNEKQIWWYSVRRDNNINVGDMVLVYQGGENREAYREGITNPEKIKYCFIGNFTIGRKIEKNDPANDPRIQVCWTEPDDGWLQTYEPNFLWKESEFIKRKSLINDNALLVRAAGQPNLDPKYVGLILKNKTWIRLIEGEENEGEKYYNRVMERHYNQP